MWWQLREFLNIEWWGNQNNFVLIYAEFFIFLNPYFSLGNNLACISQYSVAEGNIK